MPEACLTRQTSDTNPTIATSKELFRYWSAALIGLFDVQPHTEDMKALIQHLGACLEVLIRSGSSSKNSSFQNHISPNTIRLLSLRVFALLCLYTFLQSEQSPSLSPVSSVAFSLRSLPTTKSRPIIATLSALSISTFSTQIYFLLSHFVRQWLVRIMALWVRLSR